MNEQITINHLVALITEGQKKADEQAKKADEQAKEATERSERLESTLRQEFGIVKKELVVVKKELVVVKEELADIKSHVLVIHGRVIGELATATKEEILDIQEDFEAALTNPVVIEQIEAILKNSPVQVRMPNGRFATKKYQRATILKMYSSYFGVPFVKTDYRKQPGQFGARTMRDICGVDFGSSYPVEFSSGMAKLAYFYQNGYNQPKTLGN